MPVAVLIAAIASVRFLPAESSPPQPDLVVAAGDQVNARLVADRTPRALPPGVGSERGLQIRTILAERAISARFPQIREIGGWRPDPLRWHPEGLAIDVMIPGYQTPAGKALGDEIVAFAFANAARWGLMHVIWQQTYMPVGGPARLMPDRGSPNANHYTHVHIATAGGGYPAAGQLYFG